MPRYVKQRNRFSCGQVAYINALKWAGQSASLGRDYVRSRKLMNCAPRCGVEPRDFERVLMSADAFSVHRVRNATVATIKKHLRSGGSVVLDFAHGKRSEQLAHYVFLFGIAAHERWFAAANYEREHTLCPMSVWELAAHLRLKRKMNGRQYPCVWLLS